MTGPSISTLYFDDVFRDQSVMAILRGLSPVETVAMCTSAWDAGIEVVEVPVQTPDAIPSLEAAVEAGRDRNLGVGAGTVTNPEQLRDALARGADFSVAPGLDAAVSAESHRAGKAHLPGVATATEIVEALALGHVWQKAFPAAQLTPGWVRAQRAPFPGVHFVATGGVDQSNAADFLAAGCRVVAVGSALADPAALRDLAIL